MRVQHHSSTLPLISNDFIILATPLSSNLTGSGLRSVLPFKWNTDCFSCLFTTHGSAALRNRLFLPRTIWRISWIKMILIISQWKDPWQLWIPLEADQRPLVPHFYGQSNSVGPAWVTKDTGCLHSSVFIIYPPSSLLYHFNLYRIMDFWSPEAPLCVLLLDKIFIYPELTLTHDTETKMQGKVIAPLEVSWARKEASALCLLLIPLTYMEGIPGELRIKSKRG